MEEQLIIPKILDASSQANLQQYIAKYSGSVYGHVASTAVTSIATNTFTKLTPTLNYVQGMAWDATNHQFIVSLPGIYFVTMAIAWNASSGYQVEAAIYKNGTLSNLGISSAPAAGTSGATAYVTDIIKLNPKDTIQFYAFQDSGGNLSIYNTPTETYMSMAKI